MIITCGIYLYSVLTKKILICHPTHARWNQWSIPKGLKEDGEELFTVASRELAEETGINIANLHIIKTFELSTVKYAKQNKVLESFLVITDSDLEGFQFTSNMVANGSFPEVDKWKWIPLEELNKWVHESQCKNRDVIIQLLQSVG